jgi:hypothetical protein
MKPIGNRAEDEEKLVEMAAAFRYDPLGYVLWAYDWGYGELAQYPKGPEDWQREILEDIGAKLKANRYCANGERPVIRIARASGNGIGKSALMAWLIDWGMSCAPDTRINITAETEPQLRTKTWPTVSTWTRRCITGHWFDLTATALASKQAGHERDWRTDMMAWSKNNPESFAGLHNAGKLQIQLFDEASAIDDVIFDTAEGAWTDRNTDIICVVFGNPTRNNGYFYDCFNKNIRYWNAKQIDARTVKLTNKTAIAERIEAHGGEESDWTRVHVRGLFPISSEMQYIPTPLVEAARRRTVGISAISFAPVILALDPSWTGKDEWCIVKRQGLMSWLLAHGIRNEDDNRIGGLLAKLEDEHHADAVFIDQGWGTGVYSFGKGLGRKWQLVSFAEKPVDPYYKNKRMEMYAETKKWLEEGGCLPDDGQLCAELTYPEAFINKTDGKLQLESKDDMKERGLPSPNRADALALTFARRVAMRPKPDGVSLARKKSKSIEKWDPLAL